jgi:hypothetical protein
VTGPPQPVHFSGNFEHKKSLPNSAGSLRCGVGWGGADIPRTRDGRVRQLVTGNVLQL